MRKKRVQVRIPALGEQINSAYEILLAKDEGKAIQFIDKLEPAQKKAVSTYWRGHGHADRANAFFRGWKPVDAVSLIYG